jgi:hypothetical protein
MLVLGTDSATIASLATAGGTLVLAIATFASVRSANRSARIAEEALREQRQPVFAPSRFSDPRQKIMFVEGHWVHADGGRGVVEHANGNVYLAISLRNVGSGIGVCQGWAVSAGLQTTARAPGHMPLEDFRTQTRDLYIPPGDIGMWQGALRDPDHATHRTLLEALDSDDTITVELLYSDQVGGQRTITRFGLTPFTDPDTGEIGWFASTSRHWFLDRPGPRSEEEIAASATAVLRRVEAIAEANGAESDGADADQADAPYTPRSR